MSAGAILAAGGGPALAKWAGEAASVKPPTREEAKAQFHYWTEKLGLKHTFTFDEMYDGLMELRRRREYREKVVNFEEKVKQLEGAMVGDCYPLTHTFADGQYVRQITVPAQTLTVTKIHAQTHPFFILKGTVTILTEKGVVKLTAPYSGITKAGTKRVIFHHDEVVLTTVHRTDKTNLAEIEDEVIAKNFQALDDGMDQSQIEDFIKQITDDEINNIKIG